MRQEQVLAWWTAWRRRTSAWGAVLDAQHILLVALAAQSHGPVRVAVFEHQHSPAELLPPEARDSGLVAQLRQVSAQLPRRERRLALALHESRCSQGQCRLDPDLPMAQLVAEVQLEAAQAMGVAPQEVGFDFELQDDPATRSRVVHWAACRRQDLQHWQDHARRAGWRLPLVEPEHQAAHRAACCLQGEAWANWAQSPQDWQFERSPVRDLDEGLWQAVRASPQWGPLVACGAALRLMA